MTSASLQKKKNLFGPALALLLVSSCAPAQRTSGAGDRIAERFMQADSDGDGFISRSEAPSRIDFDAADTNSDGLLSLSEVEAFTEGLRGR